MFSGEKSKDVCVNVLDGSKNKLSLTHRQFSDFAIRLIAYVYTTESHYSDEELKMLWELRLNIFDNNNQKTSKSVFQNKREDLVRLGLMKRK